jgi:hypothetical protein
MKRFLIILIILLHWNNSNGQDFPLLKFDSKQKRISNEQIESIKTCFGERDDLKKHNIIIVITYVVFTNIHSYREIDLNRVMEVKKILVDCGFEENRIHYRFLQSRDLIFKNNKSIIFNAYMLK